MDAENYKRYQAKRQEEHEAICRRCGRCCGIGDGDPCENLRQEEDGLYSCQDYKNRFGLHKSQSGREFVCVPIRSMIHKNWAGRRECAYVRQALNNSI